MKTLSSEILHQNPWWQYKHDTYELRGGIIGNYYYAETRGVSIIIPRLPDGTFFLVRQFRYLKQRDSWEFPGGGLKEGQSPEDAARAELREEAGLNAENLILLGEIEPSNGFIKDHTYLWLADVAPAATNDPDSTEIFSATKTVTATEFEQMLTRGEVWDGQSLAAWCLAKAKGLV